MRRKRRTGPLAGALVLWLGAVGGHAQPADLAADVKTTADVIVAGDAPGEIPAALVRLVTLASRIAAEGKLPEAVRTKLEAAGAAARPEGLLGEKSRASLREAYALLNEGRPFAMPKGEDGVEALMAHGRKQVDRSVAALGKAKSEEAARELVGFILLVITPMEQGAGLSPDAQRADRRAVSTWSTT
jgi:hypothetical protein